MGDLDVPIHFHYMTLWKLYLSQVPIVMGVYPSLGWEIHQILYGFLFLASEAAAGLATFILFIENDIRSSWLKMGD